MEHKFYIIKQTLLYVGVSQSKKGKTNKQTKYGIITQWNRDGLMEG